MDIQKLMKTNYHHYVAQKLLDEYMRKTILLISIRHETIYMTNVHTYNGFYGYFNVYNEYNADSNIEKVENQT